MIGNELDLLLTEDQKQTYLENIWDADQGIRKTETLSMEEKMKSDIFRIKQVGAYMDRFGYPSEERLGTKAASTPSLVIHHSPYDSYRYENFHHLYKGYIDGSLSPESFAFFLGRFQKNVNGSWITFDRPFTTQEEIDTLIKSLKLEGQVELLKNAEH